MQIHLQSLNWYPDETDDDVIVDFTVQHSEIGGGNGSRSEATDIKFRVCQEDVMPAVGIQMYLLTKLDLDTQRVVSDMDALIVIPRETWTPIDREGKRTQFISWLTLVVGRMYLAD